MTPTNEAGHGLPEVAAAREVIRAYFAGELDDTMILNLSESLALSRGVPEGWRVSNADRGRAGDGWEVYAPDGSGGVVSKYDVKDWIVRDLLNALAAAPAAAGAQGEDAPAVRGGDCNCASGRGAEHCVIHASAAWDAPQSAAADGGVRERARALFDAMLAAPYGSTTMGDIVCAETTCSRLESAWLPILEAALSSHRQAGDVAVAQVRRGCKSAPHDALYVGLIPRGTATPEVKEGDLLYLAPPPGAGLSKFRELAERWRQEAEDNKHLGGSWHRTDLCNTHADELLALVEKGAGNG